LSFCMDFGIAETGMARGSPPGTTTEVLRVGFPSEEIRVVSRCVALLSNLALVHVDGTFLAFVSLNIISTYPPLPESLLSSLLEVDEVLALSRELANQSKPEILPDSELDDEEADAATAFATFSGAAWASRFDGDPSPSIALAVCLTRAKCL
jgi:hypothetical protein